MGKDRRCEVEKVRRWETGIKAKGARSKVKGERLKDRRWDVGKMGLRPLEAIRKEGGKMADEGRGKMDDGRKDDTKDQNLLSSFIIAKRSSILHRSFAEGLTTHNPQPTINPTN